MTESLLSLYVGISYCIYFRSPSAVAGLNVQNHVTYPFGATEEARLLPVLFVARMASGPPESSTPAPLGFQPMTTKASTRDLLTEGTQR